VARVTGSCRRASVVPVARRARAVCAAAVCAARAARRGESVPAAGAGRLGPSATGVMACCVQLAPGPAVRSGGCLSCGRSPVPGRWITALGRIGQCLTWVPSRRIVHPLIGELGYLFVRHDHLIRAAIDLPVAELLRTVGIVAEVSDVQPVSNFLEHQARFGSVPADGPRLPQCVDFRTADPLKPVAGGGLETEVRLRPARSEQDHVGVSRAHAGLVRDSAVGRHQPVTQTSNLPRRP